MSHSRWNLLSAIPNEQSTNVRRFSRLVAQILYNRGLTEPSELETFLSPDESLSGDPSLLSGMDQAVARIYRALLSGENIAVYGDFDADGITATALLVKGLSLLDCKATPYIPHRMTEGYGLKSAALDKLQNDGINLVITVDCGITALPEVTRAQKRGLDVVVTDHHIPSEEIPPAVAVIDPKLPGSNYPFMELAGVGVAYKLLQALFTSLGKEQQLGELMDLVAVGTVADMVPLLSENRYLVKQGLEQLNAFPRLGIREMMSQSGLNTGQLTSDSISWKIAPLLNAAGRLEHAMGSYKLLMTESADEAKSLAEWLGRKNAERQKLTVKMLTKAREQVLAQGDAPVLIAGDIDYSAGIMGLVAGRLMEEFYRPVIVVKTGERMTGGSCRSIPEFDITRALEKCSHLLTNFGGHARAAGLGLRTVNLPRFSEEILALATAELEGVDLRPKIDIDADITLGELAGDTYNSIQQMAPFGQGNPAPVFLSRGVEVIECRTMGNGEDHLRMRLRQDGLMWDAVAFNLGKYINEMSSNIDIVYSLEIDRWQGKEKLRLNLVDFE
ncbi:single-stranded-DNA-specific exonuclease RecJ [Chloroflexota bacterium]